MGMWEKFKDKKEQRINEDDVSPEEMIRKFREGEDVASKFGKTRCFMCMLSGSNNTPTWRLIDKVICDEHKPQWDRLLRLQNPTGGEPPWERI
jgi:hypothetical protein